MVNRISLVFIPLIVMFLASLMVDTDVNKTANFNLKAGNQTVNQQSSGFETGNITFNLLSITVIISVALAIVLVTGIKVLGSGISGSVLPILFIVTITTGVFATLSATAYPVFSQIPTFGMIIYFGLCVMYIIGVAGLASSSGGD